MTKRTSPLLYIYQTKEVEPVARNQEVFYKKRLVVTAAEQLREENEYHLQTDLKDEEIQAEHEEELLAKLNHVESLSSMLKPEIEIRLEGITYVGILEKVEDGAISLRLKTAPYELQCALTEIETLKIISL